jgi:hypothetical protein
MSRALERAMVIPWTDNKLNTKTGVRYYHRIRLEGKNRIT